jgi:hypothetical protein
VKPDAFTPGLSPASLLVDAKVLFSDDFHLSLCPSIVVVKHILTRSNELGAFYDS